MSTGLLTDTEAETSHIVLISQSTRHLLDIWWTSKQKCATECESATWTFHDTLPIYVFLFRFIVVFPFLFFYLIQVLYWRIRTSKALHFRWDMLRRMHHSGYDVSGDTSIPSILYHNAVFPYLGVGVPLPSADGQGSHGISKITWSRFFFPSHPGPLS